MIIRKCQQRKRRREFQCELLRMKITAKRSRNRWGQLAPRINLSEGAALRGGFFVVVAILRGFSGGGVAGVGDLREFFQKGTRRSAGRGRACRLADRRRSRVVRIFLTTCWQMMMRLARRSVSCGLRSSQPLFSMRSSREATVLGSLLMAWVSSLWVSPAASPSHKVRRAVN